MPLCLSFRWDVKDELGRIRMCAVISLTSSDLCVFLRPLFKDDSGTVDKSARFSALYRQDGNKLSNEDMFRLLADFRKSVLQ